MVCEELNHFRVPGLIITLLDLRGQSRAYQYRARSVRVREVQGAMRRGEGDGGSGDSPSEWRRLVVG